MLGCGSVGGLAAWACVSAGVGTVILADRDRLEAGNSRRHVCGSGDQGRSKTTAVAEFLRLHGADTTPETVAACFLANPDAVNELLGRCEIALVAVDTEGPRAQLQAALPTCSRWA